MATIYDNLVLNQLITGNNCSANTWYTRVDSGSTTQFLWSGKGVESGYSSSSDYYIALSTVSANADSQASPEADSYTTDVSGNTDHAFVIDGGDTLYYPTANIIKANVGSICLKWQSPLPYNKFTGNSYLFDCQDFIRIYYNYSDYKFYFQLYDGTDFTAVTACTTAQSFSSAESLKLCFNYDNNAASANLDIYIDDYVTSEGSYGITWTEQTVATYMYWGSDYNGNYQSDGAFDELRIYIDARSESQRNTLFNTTWG